MRSCKLRVNRYVVTPLDFRDLANAVKELGAFRAVVNEPLPARIKKKSP